MSHLRLEKTMDDSGENINEKTCQLAGFESLGHQQSELLGQS